MSKVGIRIYGVFACFIVLCLGVWFPWAEGFAPLVIVALVYIAYDLATLETIERCTRLENRLKRLDGKEWFENDVDFPIDSK